MISTVLDPNKRMALLAMMQTDLPSSETWQMVAWTSLVAESMLESSLVVNRSQQGIV